MRSVPRGGGIELEASVAVCANRVAPPRKGNTRSAGCHIVKDQDWKNAKLPWIDRPPSRQGIEAT